VSPTITRTLMPARADEAITLRAGEPDSVVVANVVRVMAADSGPAATSALVSTGPETVGVAHQWLEGARGVRGQPPEQLDGRVRDGRRHRVAVDLQDGAGEPGGRAVPGRRGGVPAAPLDAEHDAGRALLGDADRADRRP
jgi:hypothetical protein